VRVVTGDARLTLARAPQGAHDLVIVDAFSSDAIPVHLLTVEAVRMYVALLRPGGVALLHVSHRYLDLARVVAGAAARLGLASAIDNYAPPPRLEAQGVRACTVVALAPDAHTIARLPGAGWTPLRVASPVVWTDDRSSLLDVLGGP
jgi:spermidine synthase